MPLAQDMLLELSIKDFAIIDNLRVSFGKGLNIFTGETGAGKSIIMDAIALILGERASTDIIRAAKDEAQVEAMFDISGCEAVASVLEEAGIENSGELVVKRVVQRAGRNRIYINGSLATLVTLTEVGRWLIDIYGQSEHQSLTRPEEHIEVLDSFGGFAKLRDFMEGAYREYVSVKKELDSLIEESRSLKEKRDLLEFQCSELTEAAFIPGEDEELKKLKEKLQNSEKIKSIAAGAERELYSEAGSIVERLGSISRSLKEIKGLDEKLSGTAEAVESALYSIEDAASFLRGYAESMEVDPEGLESVLARLDLINRLKKKYSMTIEELIARAETLEGELSGLSAHDEKIKELEGSLSKVMQTALEAATNLSGARKASGTELEKRIEEELATLGMKGCVFEVIIEADTNPDGSPRLGEKGADRVSFFISTNPGEGIKPLARIASGGELSRIMLAMKRATAAGRVPILIFDEIDTGIGGAMAQVVGLKLKEVSGVHQVICITHLPQVAAFADRHFLVSKAPAGDGRTVTSVQVIEGEELVDHLSVMLGGMKVTDTTRKHASELLAASRDLSGKKTGARRKAREK